MEIERIVIVFTNGQAADITDQLLLAKLSRACRRADLSVTQALELMIRVASFLDRRET